MRGHDDFERVLNALNDGELDLLVGTQMIAKGHDIHGVTLVGVVGADMALGPAGFPRRRANLSIAHPGCGRAGRGETPGKVVLQTYFPDHYAVQYAAHHDFAGFYEKELRFRSWMHYPPYSALANVMVRSDKLDEALRWSGTLGTVVRKNAPRRRARAGPGGRAHRAAETRLSLSLHFEIAQPPETERAAASHAGLCRKRKNSAHPGDRRCGRAVVDVKTRIEMRNEWVPRPSFA